MQHDIRHISVSTKEWERTKPLLYLCLACSTFVWVTLNLSMLLFIRQVGTLWNLSYNHILQGELIACSHWVLFVHVCMLLSLTTIGHARLGFACLAMPCSVSVCRGDSCFITQRSQVPQFSHPIFTTWVSYNGKSKFVTMYITCITLQYFALPLNPNPTYIFLPLFRDVNIGCVNMSRPNVPS